MRNSLHQYFKPTAEEFKNLWERSLISLDASVLLNIYGYSKSTRMALIDILDKFNERLIIPHQFALEYARNRAAVIVKQIENCKKTGDAFKEIQTNRLQPKREHPHLSDQSYQALKKIEEEIELGRLEMEKLIGLDPYADMILRSFEGKIGEVPDEDRLKELHTKADERIIKKIPPGYMDLKSKGVPGAYGDFIGWEQLIVMALKSDKDILLVTDENKEDWWYFEGSRTVAPRSELLAEFFDRTNKHIWIYNSDGFLRAAQEFGGAVVEQNVLQEVEASAQLAIRERTLDMQKPKKEHGEASPDGAKAPTHITTGKPSVGEFKE